MPWVSDSLAIDLLSCSPMAGGLHLPLQLYPTLLDATPRQRKAWQMIGPGKAFHWKELDLDLSVDGLIRGLREAIPRLPTVVARRSGLKG